MLVIFSGFLLIIMSLMTHDEVLKKVCGLCLKKPKHLENISVAYLKLIHNHHYGNYNLTSGDFPKVICPSCKKALRDKEKFGDDAKSKLPDVRYHLMRPSRTSRSSGQCQCYWCYVWRLKGGPYQSHCLEVSGQYFAENFNAVQWFLFHFL